MRPERWHAHYCDDDQTLIILQQSEHVAEGQISLKATTCSVLLMQAQAAIAKTEFCSSIGSRNVKQCKKMVLKKVIWWKQEA